MECSDNIVIDGISDPCPLFKEQLIFGKTTYLCNDDSTKYVRECLQRFSGILLQGNECILLVDSVEVNGILYKPGKNTYLLTSAKGILPQFGRLSKIWYIETIKGLYFAIHLTNTQSFCEQLNAYKIEEENIPTGDIVVNVTDVPCPTVFHAYHFEKELHIVKREDF